MPASSELYIGYPKGEHADRERQSVRLERLVGMSGIDMRLTTETDRDEFVNQLTPKQFVNYLIALNGIVMNLPRNERCLADSIQFTGDSSKNLFTDVMPAPEDKEFLLGEVLKIAQGVKGDHIKALILGYGINAVHPFLDGNGRVARSVYSLISRGYEPSNGSIMKAMDPAGERGSQLDGMLFSPATYQLLQEKMGTHETKIVNGVMESNPKIVPLAKNQDVHPCEVDPVNREWNEEKMVEMALIFNNKNLSEMIPHILSKKYNTKSVRQAMGKIGPAQVFYLDEFFRNATDKEIGNVYDVFRDIKRRYVLTMINTLAVNENKGVQMVGQTKDGAPYVGSWLEIGLLVSEGVLTAPESGILDTV